LTADLLVRRSINPVAQWFLSANEALLFIGLPHLCGNSSTALLGAETVLADHLLCSKVESNPLAEAVNDVYRVEICPSAHRDQRKTIRVVCRSSFSR